jgi:hypothetical protein
MPNAARQTTADAPTDPITVVRSRADALYRAAIECCRQHDRSAKLSSSPEDPELEHKHLDALCRMCDGSLAEMATAYKKAAGDVDLESARGEAWWPKANSLWQASREYARHHAGCDDLSRKVASKHDAGQLASMQMEYELEASALLALRHAAEAYKKTRPELK